jgi:hypothetical protein
MKRDPGPLNQQFFGFGRGPMPETMTRLPEMTEEVVIPGRRGAAERNVRVRHTAPDASHFRCAITTEGWYPSTIELNDHQVKRLLDVLKDVELPS